MKKTLILLTSLLLGALTSNAQITTGIITYDQAIHMNGEMPPEAAQFRDLFPRELHTDHTLMFTPDASVYKAAPPKPEAAPKRDAVPEGDFRLVVNAGGGGDDIMYTDLKAGRSIEQTDLFSRKFLINDELKKRAWRNTGVQKTILGYQCQEAVSTTANDTVTAWFTTSIPVSTGPRDFAGLPGMILQASQKSEQADVTITATKIEEGLNGKSFPSVPNSGKKVSREEFTAIADAKRKEMQQQFGGSGNMIIHIEKD